MEKNDFIIIKLYKDFSKRILKLQYPNLTEKEIEYALDYSINKRLKNNDAFINNNYKNIKVDTNILELTEYILSKKPIITSRGVMFSRHDTGITNPIEKILRGFMEGRSKYKAEMFKYPKGSEMFEKYNLLQLLAKLDANALYGAFGQTSCLYFNIHVASSITTQGRSCISAAGLQFEMFLDNNVDFASLTEIVAFIDNVINEDRKYDDTMFLDRNITVEECCYKLMYTCGFGYIPTTKDIDSVMNILCSLKQEDINRLYYKNNLFEFMNNNTMKKCIISILGKLRKPYIDPNEVPEEINVELHEFINILKEYVYYHHQILERIGKFSNMIRSVVATTDTDSCIVSLDGWYRYILNIVKDEDILVKKMSIENMVDFIKKDEFGEFEEKIKLCTFEDIPLDYDFYNDETIELERTICPCKFIPQDSLRYSIINIMAYALTLIVNDYMYRYTVASNSVDDAKPKSLIYLKNEFLFKRALLTDGKKNYASIQELQEGNVVGNKLDVKGLPMNKSGLNKTTQDRLKKILYEDILNTDTVDQIKVIKKLAIFEDEIFKSLMNGDKTFYKPLSIKALNSYEDPMRIFGMKGCIFWNSIKDDGVEGIDLDERNELDVLKINIDMNSIDKLKEVAPDKVNIIIDILNKLEFKGCIKNVSVPKEAKIPDWLIHFIDYTTIINDNLSNMTLEPIGIRLGNDYINYTNMISI